MISDDELRADRIQRDMEQRLERLSTGLCQCKMVSADTLSICVNCQEALASSPVVFEVIYSDPAP